MSVRLMLVGHFAAALAGKRAAPDVSLGTLLVGAMLADLLAWPLILAGVEQGRIVPGLTRTNTLELVNAPYSHGLLFGVIWAVLLAGAWFLGKRSPRGAAVLACVVLSHWVLDFISHLPDMPLAPGSSARFGLGLYNSYFGMLLVEGGLWIAAIALYVSANRPQSAAGRWGFWIPAALFTLIWLSGLRGTPPPNLRLAAISGTIFFLLVVAWAYWMEYARGKLKPRSTQAQA